MKIWSYCGGKCERWTDVKKIHTPVCFRTINSKAHSVSNVLFSLNGIFTKYMHIFFMQGPSDDVLAISWLSLKSIQDPSPEQESSTWEISTLVSEISCLGKSAVIIKKYPHREMFWKKKNWLTFQGALNSQRCRGTHLAYLIHQLSFSRTIYKLPFANEYVP